MRLPPLSSIEFRYFSIFLGIVVFYSIFIELGFIVILDHFNIFPHEAGHLIFFFLFGADYVMYGGTVLQLALPILITYSFYSRRQTMGFAVCLVWVLENFLNIARYMADARTRELPLLFGVDKSGHDWYNILGHWGLLAYDKKIANVIIFFTFLSMAYIWIYFALRLKQANREKKHTLPEPPRGKYSNRDRKVPRPPPRVKL